MESMQGGGAEKVLLDLLANIDKSRYEIELLIVFRTGALLDRLPSDIPVTFLYPGKPKGVRRIIEHFVAGRDFLYNRDAQRFASGKHWDVIISFMEGPALKIHNCIADKADRNITWVHINLGVTHWTKFLYHDDKDEASDYHVMDNIVFVSNGAKQAFSDKFGITGDHLKVIHNIIPVETIRERAKEFKVEKDKFTLCTVGRLVEQKRFDRLLEAVSILIKRGLDFRLWILGAGKLEAELKAKSKQLGLDDYVYFLGFQSNPYPYLSAADIFVLSSDTEGYPTVVCEAISLGKPIVSTDITGSRELLENGIGILTDTTAEALADGILSLMNNKEHLNSQSKIALKASERFDKGKVLEKIYQLIDA